MSESISPVRFCCAGNCSQDVEVSVRALLMRTVRLNLSLCLFQILAKMIAQNNIFRLEPAADHIGKERRGKKRGEEACRAVCGSLQIVWMKRHSCLSCLIMFFFRLAISFSFPLVTVSHFFLFLPLHWTPLFLPYLSFCLPEPYVCLNRLAFPFSLPGLGSVASNAFHSAWLSQHMYPLYIIARTHSCTNVPADLISPSLSSLSPTTPDPNEKT